MVKGVLGCRQPASSRSPGWGSARFRLLLPDADDCDYPLDLDQLEAGMAANPAAFIVYNQNEDAAALIDRLRISADRVLIEIRQDTKGVLGLHAMRRSETGLQTLELIYQE